MSLAVFISALYQALTAHCVAENVALNKPAVQSSTYNTATAARANDDDPNSVSCTLMATLTPWWSVDLGTPMVVERVQVTNDANTNYGQLRQTLFVSLSYHHHHIRLI